ncbi:unnamed protein product [Caretta caretta]
MNSMQTQGSTHTKPHSDSAHAQGSIGKLFIAGLDLTFLSTSLLGHHVESCRLQQPPPPQQKGQSSRKQKGCCTKSQLEADHRLFLKDKNKKLIGITPAAERKWAQWLLAAKVILEKEPLLGPVILLWSMLKSGTLRNDECSKEASGHMGKALVTIRYQNENPLSQLCYRCCSQY